MWIPNHHRDPNKSSLRRRKLTKNLFHFFSKFEIDFFAVDLRFVFWIILTRFNCSSFLTFHLLVFSFSFRFGLFCFFFSFSVIQPKIRNINTLSGILRKLKQCHSATVSSGNDFCCLDFVLNFVSIRSLSKRTLLLSTWNKKTFFFFRYRRLLWLTNTLRKSVDGGTGVRRSIWNCSVVRARCIPSNKNHYQSPSAVCYD